MKDSISNLAALLFAIEMLFLGGSFFVYKESTRNILRVFVIIFGIVAIAIGW